MEGTGEMGESRAAHTGHATVAGSVGGTGAAQETAEPHSRLFVAVPLPAVLLAHVQEAQALLPTDPKVRRLRPDQLHITLAFIGEVAPHRAEAARRVVVELPTDLGGEARMRGLLMLPSASRPRVVTLAVEDTSQVFARLFEVVMGGLEAAGVMRREKRPFRPHLTIARVKSGLVQPKADVGVVPYRVESVRLYRSELKRTGAEYTVVAERRLRPPEGDMCDVGEGR